MTTWTYPRSVVLAVTDGDSVTVALDRGFDDKSRRKLRLLGIDAAELRAGDPAERERARRAKARVLELLPVGSECTVVTHRPDKYGSRYLAEVLLPDGRDLAGVLLAEGLARAYDGGRRGPAESDLAISKPSATASAP